MESIQQVQQAQQAPQEQQPVSQGPVDPAPDASPDQDPAYVEAVNYVRGRVWRDGLSDRVSDVARMKALSADQMAIIAYTLIQQADEATGGNVQDDNLVSLAIEVLSEIIEIAIASGVDVTPTQMVSALKRMMVKYLTEQGVDASEIQKAMNQVTPDQFNKINEKVQSMEGAGNE